MTRSYDAPCGRQANSADALVMLRADPADRAGTGAHDDALGFDAATLAALDARKQRAVRDARRCENAVALRHVFEPVNPVEVLDSPTPGPAAFVVVAEQEPALDLSADAAQRRS